MESGRQSQHPATMEPREPWDGDGLTRESLPPDPRSPWSSLTLPQSTGTRVLLGALALLLVITVVGTSALLIRDLHAQGAPPMSTSPAARATATATATVVSGTPTLTPAPDPKGNGWTEYTAGVAGGRVVSGDVKFAASSPQRGYLCGMDNSGRIIFGMTTNGGQTWVVGRSPAANEECSIQVSAANALDIALTSVPGSCGDPCPTADAHYSTDGGKTWKAAPIPPNTFRLGSALWSGAYLYVWAGAIERGLQQSGFLKVSANGGAFTSIDPNTLLPGAQTVSIGSAVASGTKLYLNLTYTGCSSQNCLAIVASGDGGKTWTQIPNESDIQLMYVSGSTLYGQAPDPQALQMLAEWTSSDSGAAWTQLKLPPLPGGRPTPFCWPAPDGTLFGAIDFVGVVYLRAGSWTVLPLSRYGEFIRVAVSVDASGKPKTVWAVDDGQDSWAGIYWQALP